VAELAGGEAVMRMTSTGQPQMPFPGMPMMHMRPGMPGMPPNFRGMIMPFVSFRHFYLRCCRFYCGAETVVLCSTMVCKW